MRRLYFLAPDVSTTRRIVRDLLLNHVAEEHIHLIARRDVPLEDLPEASMAQKSDLIPALERGAAAGAATGAVAGLVAVAVPPAGIVLGGGAVLGAALAGAGFGAWAASMMGISTPNSRLKKFEEAVEAGQVLMLVDVKRGRVDEVEALIRAHHPEATISGTEPHMPNFP
ncbi:DUF1269 domain-containing protein [Alkalilimnicola sp. S0819]|uniref:DUF1269 domain-containing protein n=1 Tax=Alkalilimnicola sp. S0819 TaxID=2613922 RepID=UPI001261B126|nr:DUF1269 domain-containing protein [Alkalilimnicola sp. S0819]KAB7628193.1 DUF1269 domain-containing protein [Alkalilimnicola sp. S0819]MPQ15082.1 DUF1269 domain-containing protein [Alkalilimnicola sp. S0819]